jgi:hypothetical protein
MHLQLMEHMVFISNEAAAWCDRIPASGADISPQPSPHLTVLLHRLTGQPVLLPGMHITIHNALGNHHSDHSYHVGM